MLNTSRPQGVYNMGAVVGTAIHAYLEDYNTDPEAQREMRVTLGEIPGYGKVSSTTDLYLPQHKLLVDFKTTDRKKLARYQRVDEYPPEPTDPDLLHGAYATMQQYYRQAQLYAWGVEQLGHEVEQVAIVFVCRDGQIVDRDIWSPQPQVYNRAIAEAVFGRAVKLWEYLQDGGDPEQLTQDEYCYYCNAVRPYVIEPTEL